MRAASSSLGHHPGGSGGGDGGAGRSAAVQDEQNDGQDTANHDGLGPGGVAPTVLAHLEPDIGSKGLHLLGTKLVVNQTTQGDRVTDELLGSNGVTEDNHGGNNQKDILQDTSHGQDDSGSLANLEEG